jgi:hypothetical protein
MQNQKIKHGSGLRAAITLQGLSEPGAEPR